MTEWARRIGRGGPPGASVKEGRDTRASYELADTVPDITGMAHVELVGHFLPCIGEWRTEKKGASNMGRSSLATPGLDGCLMFPTACASG